ncbi:MAG: hypothetical protein D3906_18180, partial [Candidatus Electrothrix sp. AUS1_2]|nr:hypothetical protein [Candidatus Electrothrix sp. AUS1_2]
MLSLSAALILSYKAASYKEQVYAEAKEKYHAVTEKMAQHGDALLRRAMEAADSFAEGLTEGTITRSNMGGKFKKILKEYNGIYGGSITFSPFSYDPARKLYSVYFHRAENGQGKEELHFSQLDEIYDYTTSDYEWYVRPMSEQKNGWGSPYWDEAGKTYMITYSSLFYKENGDDGEKEPAGVVTVDISMKYIKRLIDEQDLGRSGFCAVTTAEGRYIYHPVRNYVVEGKTLQDVAKEKNDKDREQLADMARKGQGGIIEHISTTTGEESWLMVEPIPITGWSLQNTFIKNDIEFNTDVIRHRKILACISTAVFMINLLALMLTPGSFSMKKIGIFVISSSIVMITGIG